MNKICNKKHTYTKTISREHDELVPKQRKINAKEKKSWFDLVSLMEHCNNQTKTNKSESNIIVTLQIFM